MVPHVTFPAHTQARMAAANAAKELKKSQAEEPQPSPAVAPPALPGHVDGLSIGARQDILRCEAKVIIGYGSLEAFYPLAKNVNLAMLQYCQYHPFPIMRHHIFLLSRNWSIILVAPDQSVCLHTTNRHSSHCRRLQAHNCHWRHHHSPGRHDLRH